MEEGARTDAAPILEEAARARVGAVTRDDARVGAAQACRRRVVIAWRDPAGCKAADLLKTLVAETVPYASGPVNMTPNQAIILRKKLIGKFLQDFNNHDSDTWDAEMENYVVNTLGLTSNLVNEFVMAGGGEIPVPNRNDNLNIITAVSTIDITELTHYVGKAVQRSDLGRPDHPHIVPWSELIAFGGHEETVGGHEETVGDAIDVLVLCGHGSSHICIDDEKALLGAFKATNPKVVVFLSCNMCAGRGDMVRLAHYPDSYFGPGGVPIFVGFDRVLSVDSLERCKMLTAYLSVVLSSSEILSPYDHRVSLASCARLDLECGPWPSNLVFFNDQPRVTTQNRIMRLITELPESDSSTVKIHHMIARAHFDSWGYCLKSDIIPLSLAKLDDRLATSEFIHDNYLAFLKKSCDWEGWLIQNLALFQEKDSHAQLLKLAVETEQNMLSFVRALSSGFGPGASDKHLCWGLLAPFYRNVVGKLSINHETRVALRAGLASVCNSLYLKVDGTLIYDGAGVSAIKLEDLPLNHGQSPVFSVDHLQNDLLYNLNKYNYRLMEPHGLFFAVDGDASTYTAPTLRSHLSLEGVQGQAGLMLHAVQTSESNPFRTNYCALPENIVASYSFALFHDVVSRMVSFYVCQGSNSGVPKLKDESWKLELFANRHDLPQRGFHFNDAIKAVESRAAARQYPCRVNQLSQGKPKFKHRRPDRGADKVSVTDPFDKKKHENNRLYDCTLSRCRFVLAGEQWGSDTLLLFYTDVHYGDDMRALLQPDFDVFDTGMTVSAWGTLERLLRDDNVPYPLHYVATIKLHAETRKVDSIEGPKTSLTHLLQGQ